MIFDDVQAGLGERITRADWMDDATRKGGRKGR